MKTISGCIESASALRHLPLLSEQA